jgi:hypothetical protein
MGYNSAAKPPGSEAVYRTPTLFSENSGSSRPLEPLPKGIIPKVSQAVVVKDS